MRILLSGGGTGGHIYPAIAIANYAAQQKKDTEILFVGCENGMESRLVPKAGYAIKYIQISGLKRRITFENLKTAVRLVTAVAKAKKIIRAFQPDVVIGTGGYVCLPVLLAAIKMKIPTMVHEQNVFPGLTVRLVASKADATAISFPETEKYFKKPPKQILLTGNPIRPELLEEKALEKSGEKLVLISGGSLGAAKLNDTLIALLQKPGQDYYSIIASTGEKNYEAVMRTIQKKNIRLCGNKKIVPYIYNMDEVMQKADLAVTRAGAITVSELCALGKPAVLVPSPNVTNDHQTYNARVMEKYGAAVLITEEELDGDVLADQIKTLLSSPEALAKMAAAAKKAAITDACQRIYTWMETVTR
ncbi:MAG: undecaprenyldiphospho-muramoylpentapeptide beta-N-acetylglucosaminyltransferase [Clostridia bacterium]|nr:undecaprenyldiphospho-muramoylpentapeptide beta-N-acetylglucosaminyltransferase [Clostridia bacterium]